jgi:uncharacterized protein (AIM24 family)
MAASSAGAAAPARVEPLGSPLPAPRPASGGQVLELRPGDAMRPPAVATPPPSWAAPAPRPGALLSEVASAAKLHTELETEPFQVWAEGAAIAVRGELLTRLTGLIATQGAVELKPERKRFRGRTTEMPFGAGPTRMMRATGQGMLIVAAPKKRFLSVDLADESAYLREDVVFAFEEPVMFENGRVPSDVAPDLDLVHLRGKGKVLVLLDGPLRTLDVHADRPATVPMQHLVGWWGNLAPKIVALVPEEGKASPAGVELTGEGYALFSVPLSE